MSGVMQSLCCALALSKKETKKARAFVIFLSMVMQSPNTSGL